MDSPAARSLSGWKQNHHRLAAHILPFEIRRHGEEGGAELDLSRQQDLLQPRAAMLDQSDVDPGVAAAIAGEKRRKEGAAAHRRQAETKRPPLQPPQLIQLGDEVVPLRQHLEGPSVDDIAGGGQAAGVGVAIEQGRADLFLQLLDRFADGRLGRENHFGGLGKAALTHHLDEGAESPELH